MVHIQKTIHRLRCEQFLSVSRDGRKRGFIDGREVRYLTFQLSPCGRH